MQPQKPREFLGQHLLSPSEVTLFFDKFKNCIKNATNRELQKAFNDKKILLTTRQPKKLRNLLVRAKFETKTIPKSPKLTGLFLCSNCVYHKAGHIIPCLSFSSKLTNGKTITWT